MRDLFALYATFSFIVCMQSNPGLKITQILCCVSMTLQMNIWSVIRDAEASKMFMQNKAPLLMLHTNTKVRHMNRWIDHTLTWKYNMITCFLRHICTNKYSRDNEKNTCKPFFPITSIHHSSKSFYLKIPYLDAFSHGISNINQL